MGIQSHEVRVPHYAALIIFELHHDTSVDEWYVRVEYKNHELHRPLLDKWEKLSLTSFITYAALPGSLLTVFRQMKDGEVELVDYIRECGIEKAQGTQNQCAFGDCSDRTYSLQLAY